MRSPTPFAKAFSLSAMLCLASFTAMAQEPEQASSWLFVQTASEFNLEGKSLTIPYEREVFAFSDRPNRQHAYLNAHEFTALWGGEDDDFSQDPPNAVLTWVTNDVIFEAEIELRAARADNSGRAIAYQIQFEEGTSIPEKAEHVSLFIDSSLAADDRFYLRKVMR